MAEQQSYLTQIDEVLQEHACTYKVDGNNVYIQYFADVENYIPKELLDNYSGTGDDFIRNHIDLNSVVNYMNTKVKEYDGLHIPIVVANFPYLDVEFAVYKGSPKAVEHINIFIETFKKELASIIEILSYGSITEQAVNAIEINIDNKEPTNTEIENALKTLGIAGFDCVESEKYFFTQAGGYSKNARAIGLKACIYATKITVFIATCKKMFERDITDNGCHINKHNTIVRNKRNEA